MTMEKMSKNSILLLNTAIYYIITALLGMVLYVLNSSLIYSAVI